MRSLGQREDGTEIGAWVLVADPDAWDLVATEADPGGAASSDSGADTDRADSDSDGEDRGNDTDEVERWELTNVDCAPLMRAGDPCIIWVTPSAGSDTGGGLWAVGELLGAAFDEDRCTFVEVSVQRLATPVPPATFRRDPDLATVEVLDHDGTGNPLTLTPHEYAEIEAHLDELDLWPEDPETDALLDAAERAALASLENLGWSLEEDDESGSLIATKGELEREVFVAVATEDDGFVLGVEELDELLWDGDPLLLVVVDFVDADPDDEELDGNAIEPVADAPPAAEVIKVDESWTPNEDDYDRRTQIYRVRS